MACSSASGKAGGVEKAGSDPRCIHPTDCLPEFLPAALPPAMPQGEGVAPPVRTGMCAWKPCQRVFLLCLSCNRGHLYCSRVCSQRARRQRQRAAGQRYQRSRRGRFKHAARQARYRARRRALQIVTHPSTQSPEGLGKLPVSTEGTSHPPITPPVGRDHAQRPQEFSSEQIRAAVRRGRQGAGEEEEGPARRLTSTSRGTAEARADAAPGQALAEWHCTRCQRSLSAPRQASAAPSP